MSTPTVEMKLAIANREIRLLSVGIGRVDLSNVQKLQLNELGQ